MRSTCSSYVNHKVFQLLIKYLWNTVIHGSIYAVIILVMAKIRGEVRVASSLVGVVARRFLQFVFSVLLPLLSSSMSTVVHPRVWYCSLSGLVSALLAFFSSVPITSKRNIRIVDSCVVIRCYHCLEHVLHLRCIRRSVSTQSTEFVRLDLMFKVSRVQSRVK